MATDYFEVTIYSEGITAEDLQRVIQDALGIEGHELLGVTVNPEPLHHQEEREEAEEDA